MPRRMPPAVERALREVIGWRNAAAAPIDYYMAIRDELERAEAKLTTALGAINALAEAYPELRAAENFRRLQAELTGVEDEIQAARRIFNSNVESYNTRTQQFPTLLIAGPLSFRPREFFEIEVPAERAVPQVAF